RACGRGPGGLCAPGSRTRQSPGVLRTKMSVISPRLAYYGDDFTGATDALATATRMGLRSLLFFGVPTAAQLQRVGPLDCLGIAGATRAMAPDAMRAELQPVA